MLALDSLKEKGTIKDYKIEDIHEDNVGKGDFRNYERLTISFLDGEKLVIEGLCSGVSEDVVLFIEKG